MKKQNELLLGVLLIFVIGFSCQSNNESVNPSSSEINLQALEEAPPSKDDSNTDTRKLIARGSVQIESEKPEEYRTMLSSLAKETNSYVSSEDESSYNNTKRYTMTVRIPSKNFNLFVDKLENEKGKIISKSISVEDVTAEFLDTQKRIENKKTLESRFISLLKNAKIMKDIIELEREINEVRNEIESMEGRIKYLANQVSFSTLDLTISSPYDDKYEQPGLFQRLKTSFSSGWSLFLSLVFGIVNIWPLLFLVPVSIFLYRKFIKGRVKIK